MFTEETMAIILANENLFILIGVCLIALVVCVVVTAWYFIVQRWFPHLAITPPMFHMEEAPGKLPDGSSLPKVEPCTKHDNSDLIDLLQAATKRADYFVDLTAFRCTYAYRLFLEKEFKRIRVITTGANMTETDWTRVTSLSDD